MILVAPRHLSGEAPWEPLCSSAGINGNLGLLCDSPSPSAGESLHLSNKPEVAQAHAEKPWARFEEPRKGLCVWFRSGITSVTASIGNVPAATGAWAAWFTREVTMLNKSYIKNDLPPAVHNNPAVIPSRRSADIRNRPREVSVSC